MIESFTGTYRWLSNFYPSPVTWEGSTYPTVEHAYQAAKTLSGAERDLIRLSATPAQAKRRGRFVTMRDDWGTEKIFIMETLLRRKFAEGDLRAWLLATGNEELQEGNYWGDRFWGVCGGSGENHLGRLLMQIRGEMSAHG